MQWGRENARFLGVFLVGAVTAFVTSGGTFRHALWATDLDKDNGQSKKNGS